MADAAARATTGSLLAGMAAPSTADLDGAQAVPPTTEQAAAVIEAPAPRPSSAAGEAGPSSSAAGSGPTGGRGAAGAGRGRGVSKKAKAGGGHKFQRELRAMMFGFGDDANPLPQSVALVEDLVVDYLQRVLHSAADACEERSRYTRRGGEAPRVKERDLLFVLRKDKRRLQRAQELLEVYEEQKEARKDYAKDHDEYAREEQ